MEPPLIKRLKYVQRKSFMRRQILLKALNVYDERELSILIGNKKSLAEFSRTTSTAASRKTVPNSVLSSQKGTSKGNQNYEDFDEESDEDGFEEVYKDSSTFLKGTQSLNPHNDYCQHFVDTCQRPQSFIRDTSLAERFEEYPKLKELIRLKDEIIASRATPPMYLLCDLARFSFASLKTKFDVILIDPPCMEYQRRCPNLSGSSSAWSWDQIAALNIGELAAARSFVFLWCGSSEGLDEGRECLRAWGFRRCEDICWVKTNKTNPTNVSYLDPRAVFQHTKEHCLMGIKGTVRRGADTDFIHANIDLDLIITEEFVLGSNEKPKEIFHIIEHFCLGRRRIHLFGNDSTIRPGWVTVGPNLTSSNFSPDVYRSYFTRPEDNTVGTTPEIEQLRPKSPPMKSKMSAQRSAPLRVGPSPMAAVGLPLMPAFYRPKGMYPGM